MMEPWRIVRKDRQDDAQRMTLHEDGTLLYLTSPALEREGAWIRHGFSTRIGGVSTGDVGSMNLSFAREESRENVRENYRRICAALGVLPEKLVLTRQTHTKNVRIVDETDAGAGYTRPRDYDDVDALVTNVPGITLVCFSADCIPLLIADPQNRAIGAAHSGWRGTAADIAGEMLSVMRQTYGTDPRDVTAVIGPSICQDCYEVSGDVIEAFRGAYPREVHPLLFYRKENGKYQLNLWEACRQNLLRAGVRPERIGVTDLCTRCNPRLLYSHRVLHGRQGNLGAFLSIREN